MLHSGTVIARKLCHFTGVSREFRLAALGNPHKISDPSARTDGLQTFCSPMKLKAYEIHCRETLGTVYCRQESVTHTSDHETSASRDPQHTDHPSRYSHRDTEHMPTERDAIHVEPYLSISDQLLWNVPMVYTGACVT
jgi:hypothetical protein